MPAKRDLETYDPKGRKNPLNRGKMPKPVTDHEIGYLEYGGDNDKNPKNRPQQAKTKRSS